MPKMHQGRRFDLYFEDPITYYRQMIEAGESNVLFDFGTIRKKKINPWIWMKRHFHGMPWKCYISGNWCTIQIDYTCEINEVLGVYPSWDYEKFNTKELRDYVERPWSQYVIEGQGDYASKPNPNQPHRIFVRGISAGRSHQEIAKRKKMTEIQKACPEVEFFIIPRAYMFGLMFGAGFSACSFSPAFYSTQNAGRVILPNGYPVKWDEIPDFQNAFDHLGYDAEWIQDDRQNAILFMIESARYAAHHWDDPTGPFHKGPRIAADYSNPDMYAEVPSYQNQKHFTAEANSETDKILCNACSLWRKCPSYRDGEVCNVTSSDTSKLVKLAQSRNADDVVNMLSSVLGMQAGRLEKRIENEEQDEDGKLDPQVDKLANSVFKNGTTLAKLLNPALARPLVQVNVGDSNKAVTAVAQSDPRVMAAYVMKEIEKDGVAREDITKEMFQEKMEQLVAAQPQPSVIEGEIEQ
ncbi:terminase small subunit [Gordonia phage Kvothe]|uniref:Uncharacterized protein n=1 Tax=Gordonia phage Kvothe TaxID=1838071 RepID=A0A160DGL7_9CAUD|nr:terminase small subunit [Gordonia phage Kvothe]ANA86074.1 hypothetical protein PBI_KVOTHE_9 [Gordonia phage Kvothe]